MAALKRAFLVRLTHCCNSSGQRRPSIGLMASMARADSSVREIDSLVSRSACCNCWAALRRTPSGVLVSVNLLSMLRAASS